MSASSSPFDHLSGRFHLLGQPARLRILLAIGLQEACVCHLEACLGYRQAYISQQLMLLREAGLLETRRAGKHIYYSLKDPRWMDLVRQAAQIEGIPEEEYALLHCAQGSDCDCPHCLAAAAKREEPQISVLSSNDSRGKKTPK